jgi:hypothetical protein
MNESLPLPSSADTSHIARDLMFVKPVLEMPQTAELVATIIFGICTLGTLLYALHVMRRDKVTYPIFLFLGSIICTTYETFDATLGHFIYPQIGQINVYQLLGVKLPLFLILIYPVYVAAIVIWVFQSHQNKRLTSVLWWKVFVGSIIGAALFEPPFIHFGLWFYYGDNQPMKVFGLPAWWWFANPAALMCMGLLCSFVWNYLLDRKFTFLLTILLPLSLFALHGSISAPLYFALNSSADISIANLGSMVTIALSFLLVWLGGRYIEKTRHLEKP